MYAWIWRKLPFGVWGRLTGSVLLLLAAVLLLWYVVFPWATPLLPFDDVQVGTPAGDEAPAGPGTSPEDEGPDEIPYDEYSNAPEPSPSR